MANCYKELLWNEEWEYISPEDKKYVFINNFDDGNLKYSQYPNYWILFGKWKGKIALFNKMNPKIVIKSISEWKTETIVNRSNSPEWTYNKNVTNN